MALGCGLMSTMKVSTPEAVMVIYMILVGLGVGQVCYYWITNGEED